MIHLEGLALDSPFTVPGLATSLVELGVAHTLLNHVECRFDLSAGDPAKRKLRQVVQREEPRCQRLAVGAERADVPHLSGDDQLIAMNGQWSVPVAITVPHRKHLPRRTTQP